MSEFIAVRSYSKGWADTNSELNTHLQKGYEVVTVTPFVRNGGTDYLEYILKAPEAPAKTTKTRATKAKAE